MNPDRPWISQTPKINDNSRHSKFLNILTKMSLCVSPVRQARIAACLVYKNEIISFGINQMKTHPFQAQFGKNKDSIFLHAETDCIKNALREIEVDELTRCTLYVCRVKFESHEKRKFVYGLAKPCPGCERAIATFNIKSVYYTLNDEGYEVL